MVSRFLTTSSFPSLPGGIRWNLTRSVVVARSENRIKILPLLACLLTSLICAWICGSCHRGSKVDSWSGGSFEIRGVLATAEARFRYSSWNFGSGRTSLGFVGTDLQVATRRTWSQRCSIVALWPILAVWFAIRHLSKTLFFYLGSFYYLEFERNHHHLLSLNDFSNCLHLVSFCTTRAVYSYDDALLKRTANVLLPLLCLHFRFFLQVIFVLLWA